MNIFQELKIFKKIITIKIFVQQTNHLCHNTILIFIIPHKIIIYSVTNNVTSSENPDIITTLISQQPKHILISSNVQIITQSP